jgi:hypothetical protein
MATTKILGLEINALSASFATTASYATSASTSEKIKTNSGGAGTYYPLMQTGASTGYYVPTYNSTLTFNGVTNKLTVTASFAETASYAATTALAPLYLPLTGGTISGNLTVLGTSSISYVSQSTLDIATNRITVNTVNPGARFGGLSVIDSGSSPQRSGSIFLDSLNDQWIFVHQGASSTVTSSLFIMGPETYGSVGSETNLTNNRLPKSVNAEHIGDSNISDTGTYVSINSATQITGSLRGQISALSIASTTASVDMSTNNFFTLTLVNAANTHINPTNINPGQTVNIRVTQGNAGTGTASFPTLVKQASGATYTGSAVANAVDIVTMITFDASTVYVSSIRNMI